MDLENVNLKAVAEEAKKKVLEKQEKNSTLIQDEQDRKDIETVEEGHPDDNVLTEEERARANAAGAAVTEEDKVLNATVGINRMLLDAYKDDPSIADVVSEVLHQNVDVGPAATKDNTKRLTNGMPALYTDGRQWYKPGNEPEGWLRGTVELPDGRILSPLHALYIIKKYNGFPHLPFGVIKTDEELLELFIEFADEALAFEDIFELYSVIKGEAANETPADTEKPVLEEKSAPIKPGPSLPGNRQDGRPAGMQHENDEEDNSPQPTPQDLGGGIIIEKKAPLNAGELAPEKMEEIGDYIANMDKDFEQAAELRKKMAVLNPGVATAQEVAELHGAEAVALINNNMAKLAGKDDAVVTDRDLDDLAEANADSREETEKRLAKFNEVIISIDKVNTNNLEFTSEERAKIEKVDKIRIEEVEMVDIQSLRRRKAKSGAVDTLLKRRGNTARSFNMIIPASGYVATMAGCSLHELMNLINEGNDPVQTYNLKWSIVHSKLITTSLGEMSSYDYFMKHTADSDLNAFIYAIMVASLPSKDSINLTCSEDACKQGNGDGRDYEFEYDVRSLLRVEEFSEEMIRTLGEVSFAATTLEAAVEVHNKSIVMSSKAIRLPDSGDVIEIQAPSAYDFLERTLKIVTNNDAIKPEYGRSAVTASRVNAVIAMDGDNDPIEITDPIEIIKFIYSLPARDIIILEHMIDKHTSNNSFSFGLVDITCPHCGTHTEVLPIDISELLFIRNAKVAETVVE